MIRSALILTVGIAALSFAAIFIRFCEDVPSLVIATYRMVIASLVLLAWAPTRSSFSFRTISRRQWFLGFLGGLFLALHFATWITSLKFTSVASSVVLVTTNPLFVGFFSYLFFREKQPPALLAGIALSITGSVIMAVGDSGLTNLAITDSRALIGDGLALLGAILASAYLMVGARLRQRTDILTTVVLVYTFSAVILLLITLAAGLPLRGFSNSSYLYMVLLALVPQIIGHTTINWALQHLRTSMVAVVILGEPIGASILAYLIFRETVGTLQLVGIFLIFSAILLASRQGKRLDPGGPPPVSDVI